MSARPGGAAEPYAGVWLHGLMVAEGDGAFSSGMMFGRPLGLMHYSRSVNPRKCAVRGERLSRHDYGRSIHNLRLTGGGEYAMPCGRESPWGCEPRLLHFFFRRSTAERLAENSYTTAEKRAKLVNSTRRLIEAQRVSAASETVACGREAGRLRQSICRLAPAPIHTSVVDALRKRWAGRAVPASFGRALASLEPLDLRKPWMNHCFVHVHGVKHSGTGLSRLAALQAWPQASKQAGSSRRRNNPEEEGQHMQDVLPSVRDRDKSTCLPADATDIRFSHYVCPLLLRLPTANATKRLWESWAWHWDVNRTILVQKSPSLEILLLDRLLPQRSHHIVTLRHPFGHHSGHHPTINTATERLEHWVASWAYALRQLASLDRYAVVRYEAIVLDASGVAEQLRAWLTRVGAPGCGATSERRGRRLEVRHKHGGFARGKANVTYDAHLVWASPEKAASSCVTEGDGCVALAKRVGSVAEALGYDVLRPKHSDVSRSIVFAGGAGGHRVPTELVDRFTELSRQLGFGAWPSKLGYAFSD